MTTTWIDRVRLVLPGEGIVPGGVLLRDGVIARVLADGESGEGTRFDGQGGLLSPGLIDLHTHGIAQYQFDGGAAQIQAGLRLLPAFGVTSILPTLAPAVGPRLLPLLEACAGALGEGEGARARGLHLEGPFMALPGAGCQTLPGDVALLDDLIAACRGRLKVMSISPETPGILPVIERLTACGIRAFITHTRASVAQTQAAIAAGARHATHFYDVFYAPAEIDPGVRPVGAVEAVLADPAVTVDFIADGVHVHPVAIRAALAAKGTAGVAVITDANIGAGLPAGAYPTPWGFAVDVHPDTGARIAAPHRDAGALAGSALTMDRALRNLLRWLPLPPAEVWAMATRTPARILGEEKIGVIAAGADADLVLWDAETLVARKVWVSGDMVWEVGLG